MATKVVNKGTYISVQQDPWEELMKSFLPMFMRSLENVMDRNTANRKESEKFRAEWMDKPEADKKREIETLGEEAVRKQYHWDRKLPLSRGKGTVAAETSAQQQQATQKTLPALTESTLATAAKQTLESQEFVGPEATIARAADVGSNTIASRLAKAKATLGIGVIEGTDASVRSALLSGQLSPEAVKWSLIEKIDPTAPIKAAQLALQAGPEWDAMQEERRRDDFVKTNGLEFVNDPGVQEYVKSGNAAMITNPKIRTFAEQQNRRAKSQLGLAFAEFDFQKQEAKKQWTAKITEWIGQENANFAGSVIAGLETGNFDEKAKAVLGIVGDDSKQGIAVKRRLAEERVKFVQAQIQQKQQVILEETSGFTMLIKQAGACGAGPAGETCRTPIMKQIEKTVARMRPDLVTATEAPTTLAAIALVAAGTATGVGAAEAAQWAVSAVAGKRLGPAGRFIVDGIAGYAGYQVGKSYAASGTTPTMPAAATPVPEIILDGVAHPLTSQTADFLEMQIEQRMRRIEQEMTLAQDPAQTAALQRRVEILAAYYEQVLKVKPRIGGPK